MRLILGLLICGAAAIAGAQDVCFDDEQKLFASDMNDGALFGVHVATDGATVVVGASDNSSTAFNAGAVYVFEQAGDDWSEVRILESDDLDPSDFVGFSVGVDGDVIVAGAWGDDENALTAGAAYVFERDEGGIENWGQRAKLLAPDGSASDLFGYDISISGGTIAVGAPFDNATELDQGSVYIYEFDSGLGDWVYVTRVNAPDPVADAQFGSAVSVDGDTLVVGAFGDNENGSFAGAAYVFARNEGGAENWGLRTKLLADTGGTNDQTNDQFGFDVDVDQDQIVIGAIRRDLGGVFSGAAYLFGRDEGGIENWGQIAELIPSDAQSGQRFGNSVSLESGRLVVGAIETNAPANDAGAAYVFVEDELGAWEEELIIQNSGGGADELFGGSVAIGGTIVVVGARQDVVGKSVVGSASVYALNTSCGTLCTADFTDDGVLDIFDVLGFIEAFNSTDSSADFTNDGEFDIFDVLGFIQAFNAGCG